MNDDQLLLERLSATDVCPAGSALPEEAWSRDVAFAEIERRVGMQTRDQVERTRAEPQKTRGWLVAAAAFIAVLVVGTATLFWLTRSGGPEVVDEPTTTTVVTTTTTPPPTTAAPSSLNLPDAWQRVGASVMTPVVGIFDMVETSSGLVAVGFDPDEEDMRQNGVIFTSADGVTWTRLAENDPALNLGAVLMYGITEGGPGIIAVGTGCEDDTDLCVPYPTVWTSADGSSWTRSAADPGAFAGSGAMLDVVATDVGMVAVGNIDQLGADDTLGARPAAWFSKDGLTWSLVFEGEWIDDAGVALAGFHAVEATPEGRLIGVGTAENQSGAPVAAVWLSPDGESWERVAAEFFAADTSIIDVAWGTSGFVAVGTKAGREPAIWRSPDGLTWNRTDTANQPFEHIGTLGSVGSLGTGWITTGPHGFTDVAGGTVTLWTSPDGLTWDRVHSIDPGYAMSVVATDSGIVVAGGMAGLDNYYAAVWAGPSFDPAAPPPDPGPRPPVQLREATGIGALEAGLTCDEIAELGFGYAEAVSYWLRYELTEGYDLDVDGPPCSQAFSEDEIGGVFGEPSALSATILENHPTGTFEVTGPAVDAGLICPTGTLEYTDDPGSDEPVLWRWEDLLTCDDGSGAFLIGVDEYIDVNGAMYGVWNIVSGTDAYVGLQGRGGTDSVFDSYDASIGRLWYQSDED
jgi:hypothetical protein